MKKSIIFIVSLALVSVMLSTFIMAAPYSEEKPQKRNEIFKAMLDNNYLFDEGFTDDSKIIEAAMLSCLGSASKGRIDKSIIKDFCKNFYDIDINENAYDPEYLTDDSFLYIPMGYDVPSHTILSVTDEGDIYIVISKMTFENKASAVIVRSAFQKNERSSFKYNLLNCEINFKN